MLETTVPTLFIIGQNSTMATLDDMEDFRERITKTETGLIVVGGANDRLIVSSSKKKFDGITQSIVDRCIADEIYEFVTCVLNPSSFDHMSSASGVSPTRSYGSTSKSPKGANTNTIKPKRKRPQRDRSANRSNKRTKSSKQENVATNSKEPPLTPVTPSTPNNPPAAPIKEVIKASSTQETPPPVINTQMALPPTAPTSILSEKLTTPKPQIDEIKVEDNTSTAAAESTPLPAANQTPRPERHYGFSYGISEVPTVISQSATRTGRQIRAPKSLDV